MTEAEARILLRDWPGVGGLEAWIASRRWKTGPGGWAVTGELAMTPAIAATAPRLLGARHPRIAAQPQLSRREGLEQGSSNP